jgi:2-oxoglutarate ferredoxin oxidoreductase subunit beta
MRGERITVIFINNAVYGMTGGQMAPTTLVGQVTTTSPGGRDPRHCGHPIRIAEMLATLEGAAYVARVSLHDPAHVARARRAVLKAFRTQLEDRGFALVEMLSSCPTNWGMSPREALRWVKEKLIPQYPLGEFRVPEEEARP